MTTITYVTKRDGSREDFNLDKIGKAILMAFRAVRPAHMPASVEDLEARVLMHLELGKDGPTIEDIQDIVERVLMVNSPDVAKAYVLFRAERTKLRGLRSERTPDKNAVADYIHPAKYGKWIKELKRRETFTETADRSADMHKRRWPGHTDAIHHAFNLVKQKRVLPSMRSMQFGGLAVEMHNARLYNCSFTLADRPRVFAESFYLLLCGCGVGFSVQFQHVERLPKIQRVDDMKVRHYRIADTIEGWSDSVDVLFDGYFTGYYVEFDYSQIRPEGSPLHVSGGKAPGHVPLRRLHDQLRSLLGKAQDRQLRPIEVHDSMCHIAEAVLSGGIRRSSLISLFSPDDGEMMYAKTPENFAFGGKNAQREMANNSAMFLRHLVTKDQFKRLFDTANRYYGEPGFFFASNLDHGCNPCGEIGLNPVYVDDMSVKHTGFSFCNLCEINAAACGTVDEFIEAAGAASMIGTLQAAYTSFPYLGEVTERIAKRDALLGVGITGIMDNPEIALDPRILKMACKHVIETNKYWAHELGVKPAKRLTTVKPSGTASLELGCVGSGIHPHHAKRYFRRITANPLEPVAQHFKMYNPHMVEVKPNGDWSLTFPVEAPANALTVKELPALDFMKHVIIVYESWVLPGTVRVDDADVGLTHNVSTTVVVDMAEWEDVFEFVWDHRSFIAAMSFLPRMGDKGIPFIPREEVVNELDEQRWEHLLKWYKPVNYFAMVETEDMTAHAQEVACAGGACDLPQTSVVNVTQGTIMAFEDEIIGVNVEGATVLTIPGHRRTYRKVSDWLYSVSGLKYCFLRPEIVPRIDTAAQADAAVGR